LWVSSGAVNPVEDHFLSLRAANVLRSLETLTQEVPVMTHFEGRAAYGFLEEAAAVSQGMVDLSEDDQQRYFDQFLSKFGTSPEVAFNIIQIRAPCHHIAAIESYLTTMILQQVGSERGTCL